IVSSESTDVAVSTSSNSVTSALLTSGAPTPTRTSLTSAPTQLISTTSLSIGLQLSSIANLFSTATSANTAKQTNSGTSTGTYSSSNQIQCGKKFRTPQCSACEYTIFQIIMMKTHPCSITKFINVTYDGSNSGIFDAECPKQCDEQQSRFGRHFTSQYLKKNSYCLKNTAATEYCYTTCQNQVRDYMSSKLKQDQWSLPKVFFNIDPPNAILSYDADFYSSSSIKDVILPREILCGECYQNISKIWIDFLENHPSTIDPAKKEFDDVTNILKGNFSKTCNTNNSNSSDSDGSEISIENRFQYTFLSMLLCWLVQYLF
ncbi:9468_t:CDS:2, partial [Ambispora leptoticha]